MGTQDGPGNIVSVEFEVFGQVQGVYFTKYCQDMGLGRMVEEPNILFILVSGVYFTKYCRDMGLQVGLGGWVKNSRSGTIIGKIQGERKKVEQILVKESVTKPSSGIALVITFR
uniref:Acylphosphatase-like domain-containing protein n=1 Tax=Timema tahoe TaxID=61484 RepID=A0A7R9I9Q3_9NEOP|nr:unnamed protein product [Timema tahoe]